MANLPRQLTHASDTQSCQLLQLSRNARPHPHSLHVAVQRRLRCRCSASQEWSPVLLDSMRHSFNTHKPGLHSKPKGGFPRIVVIGAGVVGLTTAVRQVTASCSYPDPCWETQAPNWMPCNGTHPVSLQYCMKQSHHVHARQQEGGRPFAIAKCRLLLLSSSGCHEPRGWVKSCAEGSIMRCQRGCFNGTLDCQGRRSP